MNTLNNITHNERKHFASLLENWLCRYTEEVIAKVYPRFEDIYNTPSTMTLLEELNKREAEERDRMINNLEFALMDAGEGETESLYIKGIHNHVLTHSDSYRDILYDLYIR